MRRLGWSGVVYCRLGLVGWWLLCWIGHWLLSTYYGLWNSCDLLGWVSRLGNDNSRLRNLSIHGNITLTPLRKKS